MGRKKSAPTKTVRVHIDVAILADKAASMHGQSTPDFLSEVLRPLLRQKMFDVMEAERRSLEQQIGDTAQQKPGKKGGRS